MCAAESDDQKQNGNNGNGPVQQQLQLLVGELKRLEMQQSKLKKAVEENQPLVVHPRMAQPEAEEEEDESQVEQAPPKPKIKPSGVALDHCMHALGLL